jgi:hypothetical protein
MREFRPPVHPSLFRTLFGVGIGILMLALAGVMALLAGGSHRISYVVSGGTLTVDSGSWLDGVRTVPLSLIHEHSLVSLHGGTRTRGTAMAGYCTGRWTYPTMGTVWQATGCTSKGVVLVTADGDLPIVLSPPDAPGFLAALDAGEDQRVELHQNDNTLIRILPLLGAVFALVTGGMVAVVMLLGPRRMVYRVGEGRLEVSTVFGRRSWPLQELRASPHSPRVTQRVAGTGAPGYYTGIFRVDGTNTRVYATDLKSGVLLEGPARVYLSPERVAAFLDALRVGGARVQLV